MSAVDSEKEWETDEESLVVVELSGFINNDWIDTCQDRCKILGLETERPVLQVDRYVFIGEHEDAVGTSVLFEQVKPEKIVEGEPEVRLKYHCHTHHKLCMKRGFLSENQDAQGAQCPSTAEPMECADTMENIKEAKNDKTKESMTETERTIPKN